jgi:ADP-heptose:LPS heptosyltransferase
VYHKTEKHSTEDRSERNYRILKKELEEDPDNSRTLFYLGNVLKELKSYDEAIETYRKYLKVSTWVDEKWMAQKYIGCILLWQGYYKEAIEEFKGAIEIDNRWAESYYYIGECLFLLKDYDGCIDWMLKAVEKKPPFSPLWKETSVYQDAPYRYIFAVYDVKGDYKKAIHYCKRACEKKPGNEWLEGRLLHFESLLGGDLRVIECFRQGALGDCLMTTAALRGLKEKDPGCFIRYVTHPHSMQILEGNKYIDELVSESKEEHAQKIYFSYPDKDSPLEDEGYPDKPLSRHLIKIFNECAGLPDNSMEMECTLSEKEENVGRSLRRQYKKYLTLHVKSGWSAYKDWYNDRWRLVVEKLFQRGYVTVQIGHKEDFLLRNTVDFRGHTIKEVLSAIKYADVHMGIDSFTNHVSATFFAPSVILFGSTSPIGSGYDQNINIYKDLPCQPCYREYKSKDPCPCGKKCMSLITVDEVLKSVIKLLEER